MVDGGIVHRALHELEVLGFLHVWGGLRGSHFSLGQLIRSAIQPHLGIVVHSAGRGAYYFGLWLLLLRGGGLLDNLAVLVPRRDRGTLSSRETIVPPNSFDRDPLLRGIPKITVGGREKRLCQRTLSVLGGV